jgi:hypothetical protein
VRGCLVIIIPQHIPVGCTYFTSRVKGGAIRWKRSHIVWLVVGSEREADYGVKSSANSTTLSCILIIQAYIIWSSTRPTLSFVRPQTINIVVHFVRVHLYTTWFSCLKLRLSRVCAAVYIFIFNEGVKNFHMDTTKTFKKFNFSIE